VYGTHTTREVLSVTVWYLASLCGVSATVTKLGSAADLAARVLRHYAGAVLPLPASVRIVAVCTAATRGLTAVASVRQEPC
jgi:hypothetical protein